MQGNGMDAGSYLGAGDHVGSDVRRWCFIGYMTV
jgi:hypothetical protein